MNVKSFNIGFAVVDSVISAASAAKRGVVNAAKSTVRGAKNGAVATKNGARDTADAVTSFVAGAKQAVACRRGTCRMLVAHIPNVEE